MVQRTVLTNLWNVRHLVTILAGAGGANRLVPLDGEGLRGNWVLAAIATETITMPFGIHGDNGAVCDGLLAFGTAHCEHIFVVLLAVGLAVALIERAIRQWLLASAVAHKAALVPILAHSANGALQDGLLAGGASARIAFNKAIAAHGLTILNIECGVFDLLVAVAAQEMLRMPSLAQRGDYAFCDRLIALVADDALLLLAHLGCDSGDANDCYRKNRYRFDRFGQSQSIDNSRTIAHKLLKRFGIHTQTHTLTHTHTHTRTEQGLYIYISIYRIINVGVCSCCFFRNFDFLKYIFRYIYRYEFGKKRNKEKRVNFVRLKN